MILRLIIFLLLFFISTFVKADTKAVVQPASPLDISLDEIAFEGLQLDAVVGDM